MGNLRNKSIMLMVALIVALISVVPAFADKKDAKISFTETAFDFGKVSKKDGKVSHVFSFTNEGGRNLVITNARADCGCTRPQYDDSPVAPGKEGTLKVTFVPAAKGHFTKKVTVTTNGNPRKVRLVIKGEVVE